MEEGNIISEMGAEETGKVYRVCRSFYVQTKVGPLEPILKGSLVRLLPEMAAALFIANRIEPVGDIGPEFECLKDFTTVTSDGEWLWIKRGDLLRMDREEALDQMRRGNVRERRTNQ